VSDAKQQPAGQPESELSEAQASTIVAVTSRQSRAQSKLGSELGEAGPAEWWQDPSIPWNHQPTRADLACFGWLSAAAVYGIVMSVLRPGLLASAPMVLAAQGSWSGVILTGALARTGEVGWAPVWILATLGFLKFDWIYWWAGRLWGRDLIEVWSGRSERARRINAQAEKFARRFETLAIVVNFLPIPLPRAVILVVLGEAGTSLKKFLTVSVITSFITTGCYLAVGFWIGEPAVDAMALYGKYLWYVSIAILVAIIAKQTPLVKKAPPGLWSALGLLGILLGVIAVVVTVAG
jgi:membrane protein DedA with SNARE-associated domain